MTVLLPSQHWNTSYRHEDGDLLKLFFIPALSRAVQYDRMTGYFTADALALAARGIDGLIAHNGKMRLIVGCTLADDEQAAMTKGYALRGKLSDEEIEQAIAEKMARIDLEMPDEKARDGLSALAWMIAGNFLEIRVAVPLDPSTGQPVNAPGIYHEKVGVITDAEGNKISFSGSINETRGGWVNNRESFHVHCSWEGGREWKHVEDNVEAFDRQWHNKTVSVRTVAFPEAARQKLLAYLPKDDRFVAPPVVSMDDTVSSDYQVPPPETNEKPVQRLLPEEFHEIVWSFVEAAARLENGIRVGEVTSTVKPWPHQMQSFIRMYKGWPFRLLESSEVGLGKTIIAGLTIRQAVLAGKAKRILLLVPKAVIPQWQNELYEKFNLNVPIYDGKELHWKMVPGWSRPVALEVGRTDWTNQPIVLAGSQLIRRKDRISEVIETEPWDLVVLDEAHHARRRGAGTAQEKGPNQLLSLMQKMAHRTSSLLLLTATPMQVHPVEVYDLLALLGLPAQWDDAAFLKYFDLVSGNPSTEDLAWLAFMFRETEREFGPITEDDMANVAPEASRVTRNKVLKALRDGSSLPVKRLDGDQRKIALTVLKRYSPVKYRMSRHTRSLLRAYHSKGLLTAPIAQRKVQDLIVPMTKNERDLYEAVEQYISETYDKALGAEKNAVGFVLTIYRRRLASSFYALKRTLMKRLDRVEPAVNEEDVSENELRDEVMSIDEAQELAEKALTAEEADAIKQLLKKIDQAGTETKVKRLAERLRDLLASEYDSAIIFSQFEDTVRYLAEYLAGELPGAGIGTYSGNGGKIRDTGGTWHSCSKEQIKNALKQKRIQLLVATDAAAEGLNLQFCGVLVNCDLPWNPMKVEQRIGRVDRIGQVHPEVQVINMGYKDTVEADVYLALGERINLFQGIVGKLQPILSRLPQEFEKVTLERPEHRETARQRFLADLENQVSESEQAGFDVDEVSEDELMTPALPEPGLTPESLSQAMKISGVLPAGAEWRPLDPGSYGLKLPGRDEVRVATSSEVFDSHPETMAFFSPGMPVVDDQVHTAGVAQHHGNAETAYRLNVTDTRFEVRLPGYEGPIWSLDDLTTILSTQLP